MSDTYSVIYSPEAKDDLREITPTLPLNSKHRIPPKGRSTASERKYGRWTLCRRAMPLWIGNHGGAWKCTECR